VAPLGSDLLLSTSQSVEVDTTVWTPVSAIECERNRPLAKEMLEPDESSVFVWKQEGRHRLAYLRSRCSGIVLCETTDERIDGGYKMWA
jgi:hypothetical protein